MKVVKPYATNGTTKARQFPSSTPFSVFNIIFPLAGRETTRRTKIPSRLGISVLGKTIRKKMKDHYKKSEKKKENGLLTKLKGHSKTIISFKLELMQENLIWVLLIPIKLEKTSLFLTIFFCQN